jgi:hypothetical protein
MWRVTTRGHLPDGFEQHDHDDDASVWAWSDYSGRILELEIAGYTRTGAEGTTYGRRWVSELSRGVEHVDVSIERLA